MQTALCHVSEVSDKFLKDLSDEYEAGDRVRALVKKVDVEKQRISLVMKKSALAEAEASGNGNEDADASGNASEDEEGEELGAAVEEGIEEVEGGGDDGGSEGNDKESERENGEEAAVENGDEESEDEVRKFSTGHNFCCIVGPAAFFIRC